MLTFSVCYFFHEEFNSSCIYRETPSSSLTPFSCLFYLKRIEASRTGKSRETECRAGVEEKRQARKRVTANGGRFLWGDGDILKSGDGLNGTTL